VANRKVAFERKSFVFQSEFRTVFIHLFMSHKTKCFNKISYADRAYYLGDCLGNIRDGKGKYVWPKHRRVYEGEWRNDKRHGWGVEVLKGSVVYEGEYQDDEMHGQGTYHYPSGSILTGTFVRNKVSGQGSIQISNGDRFTGEYVDNERQGWGVYEFFPSGDRLESNWIKSVVFGRCTMFFAGSEEGARGYFTTKSSNVGQPLSPRTRWGKPVEHLFFRVTYKDSHRNTANIAFADGSSWTGNIYGDKTTTGLGSVPQQADPIVTPWLDFLRHRWLAWKPHKKIFFKH
jgi:prepilin-type processing-associated H-X9-DG protein